VAYRLGALKDGSDYSRWSWWGKLAAAREVSQEPAPSQKAVHMGEPPVPFLRVNAIGGRTFKGPGRWQNSFFRSRPPRDISLEILLCALTWAPLSAQ